MRQTAYQSCKQCRLFLRICLSLKPYMIWHNVEACIQKTRFLSLDWKTMSELMMREKYSEKVVFSAAIKWFEHDLETRRQHLEDILTIVVRLPQFSTEFLCEVVMFHPLVKSVQTLSFKQVLLEDFPYQGIKFPPRIKCLTIPTWPYS